ncbi:hypothetical protein EAH89_29680, partial [Roseomonas nepalensis]
MLFFPALPALRSSLRNRLIAAFGLSFLALASLGGFAGWQLRQVNTAAVEIRDRWLPSVRVLGELRFATSHVRLNGARVLMTSEPEVRADALRRRAGFATDIEALRARYEALISSPGERRLYDAFAAAWAAYVAQDAPLLSGAAGDPAALQTFNTDLARLSIRA